MLSLPAPEDTHVQRIQQMHRDAFFRLRICILSSYMDKAALAIVRGQFIQADLMSPRRNFSIKCSQERKVKAMMLMVVVLSVQFRKTLASQAYKFGTS